MMLQMLKLHPEVNKSRVTQKKVKHLQGVWERTMRLKSYSHNFPLLLYNSDACEQLILAPRCNCPSPKSMFAAYPVAHFPLL